MKPKKIPTESTIHGITRKDDFAWIKNIKDPDLIPLLEYENKQTDLAFQHLVPLRESIFTEIISRVLEDDEDYPYPMGHYEYFYRFEKGKNYPLYFRKKPGESKETLFLDLNQKALGKDFLHLAAYRISPDQKKVAYALDFDGSEKYDLIIEEIETGKILDDSIKAMTGDFEWGDSEAIYYTVLDATHRPDRLMLHRIGTAADQDVLLYKDDNLSYYVGVSKSKSERFIWIDSASKITTEVSFVDLSKSVTKVELFTPRRENIKYDVDHHENRFIIQTNENAENFKLMTAPLDDFRLENWKTLVPYDVKHSIDGIDIYKNHIVIIERHKGLQNFRVLDCATGILNNIEFNEPLYAVGSDHNEVYDTTTLRLSYSSLKTPPQTRHYDLVTRKQTIVKSKTVPNFNPDDYEMERSFALSRDGKTQIPLSIIYKKGFKKTGNAPCFLYGYGSYGISRNPNFSPTIFSLLDRGFVYVLAHIRGGGDCGRTWYNAGKFLKKENTFFDFIDCATHLIREKYTAPKKIAICGGSAGGLLMGATINMQPELWGAVVALVPFVDVVNTMLDESLPLTVTEYDEWGNPNNPTYFKYMLSYSPYDNIQDRPFPPILATGGLHDPRVGFWEPTKWVMKLREHQQTQNPILLKMQMQAGHQGPSGRYEAYRETASYYSFVIDQLIGKV
jgi:oligopeptidase B